MHLYILSSGKYTKIGITNQLSKRLNSYNTHNPDYSLFAKYSLKKTQALVIERDIKKKFSNNAVSGHEWFDISPEEVQKEVLTLIDFYKDYLSDNEKSHFNDDIVKKEIIKKNIISFNDAEIFNEEEIFNDEQLRIVINLSQHYEYWIESQRLLEEMSYGMNWKTINGRDYLYTISDRAGNGKSLGCRKEETENIYKKYCEEKEALKERISGSREKITQDCAVYRALKLPIISAEAGRILREADKRKMLGSNLIVIGTNAIPAYLLEAGCKVVDITDSTDKVVDLAWVSETPEEGTPFLNLLKAVDSTYTVNTERNFQIRNRNAFEVEILVAPSKSSGMNRRDQPRPVPLPEQEWLLRGKFVNQVVVTQDGSPARIVAPDPRWFALQKIWMSEQEKRNFLKRPKDYRQGIALLNVISNTMPHYPLDDNFRNDLPSELVVFYDKWKEKHIQKSIKLNW